MPSNRKRQAMEICAEMLKRMQVDPLSISHIVFVENLSYGEPKKWLDRLQSAGLVKAVPNGRWTAYGPTEKGRQFLVKFREVTRLFESDTEHASS